MMMMMMLVMVMVLVLVLVLVMVMVVMMMRRRRRRRRKMMVLMLRLRKMMMLRRRRMLRRKTDPKTGTHTLCEPAQSKCSRTSHKSHFAWKFTGEMARFVRACAVEMQTDIVQEPFCMKK